MTTIKIGPPVVNATDILEYALALIEEHGWRQGPRVPDTEDWPEVAKNGLSLHDSIGMSCYRLSGETATKTRSRPKGSTGANSKEFPVSSSAREFGYEGSLREQATKIVQEAIDETGHPHGDDRTFNDQAKNVDEVLDVLRVAIAKSEAPKE